MAARSLPGRSNELPSVGNESYTVGWICALRTEYVAAQLMLDQQHARPTNISVNDNNDYTLGSIAGHNVAIAVLPEGEYGTTSAATVARDLLHSFPNIRIGLMVGIGGGAPSAKHDIRLGDIVVGVPGHGNGGILQYDYGKAIQTKAFKQTGFLDQPPTVLRTAVNGLRAQYEMYGHQLDDDINNLLQNMPRLRKRYRKPDGRTDILYRSSVIHPADSESSCDITCHSQPNSHILRPERSAEEDNPAIHYGRIASANRLMKDAKVRDKLASEFDILCFEMEAAGLMNHFPCLVVRGICDYSDSHKNKDWQGYAAMSAAAYVKDLLRRVVPNRVQAERKIVDALSTVAEKVADIEAGVKRLRIDQKGHEINKWLHPAYPSVNLNQAKEARHEGTGSWFLESRIFHEWTAGLRKCLWLHGLTGCGKTVLASTIIEHLQTDSNSVVIYFFFDFRDIQKQSVTDLFKSLTAQLYHESPCTQVELERLFDRCSVGQCQPDLTDLFETFQRMISSSCKVTIVIDALDECKEREKLLYWLGQLSTAENTGTRFITTSRSEQDIKSGLQRWMDQTDFFSIQQDAVNLDIRGYVSAQLRNHGEFRKWQSKPAVLDKIERELMSKADGMFRWAACQLEDLKKCITEPQVDRCLATLPRTLDETYGRMLGQIHDIYKQDSIRLLQFLAYSERPLTIEEAADAILTEPDGDPTFNPDCRIPEPEEIARFCPGLVVITRRKEQKKTPITLSHSQSLPGLVHRSSRDGKVYIFIDQEDTVITELQLAHFSVKEYLVSGRIEVQGFQNRMTEATARGSIVKTCLAYLTYLGHKFSSQHLGELRDSFLEADVTMEGFPLAQYASDYWAKHARYVDGLPDIQGRILCFLADNKAAVDVWNHLDGPICKVDMEDRTPLYLAAQEGLQNIVRILLESHKDSAIPHSELARALEVAYFLDHVSIAQMILDTGLDRSLALRLPLYSNSGMGKEALVQFLLNKGADTSAPNKNGETAITNAARWGHMKVVHLLLDNGAEIEPKSGDSPLYAAAEYGHMEIVQMLLDRGADINRRGGPTTALNAASMRGNEDVVKVLIDRGADLTVCPHNPTAPYDALRAGYHKVAQLLLSHGARVAVNEYPSALRYASSDGNETVVRLLLDAGIEMGSAASTIWRESNALSSASMCGHWKVVQLLLNYGVLLDNDEYYCALGAALHGQHHTVTQLLRDYNAAHMGAPENSAAVDEQMRLLDAVKGIVPRIYT